VTSVGEKEEKANAIQSPLLVFFSPSPLSAKYFHVLVKATVYPLDNEVQLLDELWVLVMTRNLHNYRLDILGGATSFRFRCTWYKRYMPQGMVRRRFCNKCITAQEMGRGGTIVDFSLLMMRSMSTTIFAFVTVLMEKFDGSLKSLALTTNTIEVLSCCTFYFVMAILLLSILGLFMF